MLITCINCNRQFQQKKQCRDKFCSRKCYHSWRSATPKIRFMRLTTKGLSPSGCWSWAGHKTKLGYGMFSFDGRARASHRCAYILFKGRIPPDKMVLHSCDNRSCVNPSHLFLGTQQDNMTQAKNRKRFPDRRGTKNLKAKITESDARIIRRRRQQGETMVAIAADYGISDVAVSYICNRKTWTHVD